MRECRRTSKPKACRYYLNRSEVDEEHAVDVRDWDAWAAPRRVQTRDLVTLGFDGSRFRDSTALIGCRLSDGYLFEVGVWERPDDVDDWEVPAGEVDVGDAD